MPERVKKTKCGGDCCGKKIEGVGYAGEGQRRQNAGGGAKKI